MPSPIPIGVPITERDGTITPFMRLRWQELIDGGAVVPVAARFSSVEEHAALPVTTLLTVTAAGEYRITVYVRKITPDSVSSSLTVTVGWTESAVPLTDSAPALTVDAITATQAFSRLVVADANSDLTLQIAYASNTPNAMRYLVRAVVERLV